MQKNANILPEGSILNNKCYLIFLTRCSFFTLAKFFPCKKAAYIFFALWIYLLSIPLSLGQKFLPVFLLKIMAPRNFDLQPVRLGNKGIKKQKRTIFLYFISFCVFHAYIQEKAKQSLYSCSHLLLVHLLGCQHALNNLDSSGFLACLCRQCHKCAFLVLFTLECVVNWLWKYLVDLFYS